MTMIRLTRGYFATVDDEDADLAKYKWYAKGPDGQVYAARTINGPRIKTVRMHKVIAERIGIASPPDHANRNRLDNRRCNLRKATSYQNAWNRNKRFDNGSGYKGVSLDRRYGKYRARILVRGKTYFLGMFASAVEAAKAYDECAKSAFGKFACLNFKEENAA